MIIAFNLLRNLHFLCYACNIVFYVMGKGLTDEPSHMWTGLAAFFL